MAANSNTSDEIELGALFNAIKRFFKRILILIYRGIRFIIKSWLIILILIILGVIAGYFWQKTHKPNQEAVLIVQTNFESTSYVYNTVNQIKELPSSEPIIDSLKIESIEIEPIINYEQLVEAFDMDRNMFITIIDNFQDEEGPYSPMAFIPQYEWHEIKVEFSEAANEKNIELLLQYLKSNPLLENIQKVALQNLEQKLVDNQKTIEQVNAILASLSDSNGLSASGLVIMGGNSSDLFEILELKNELLEENDEIRENILAQQELVVLINNPILIKSESFFTNKMILLPLLLTFIYLLISFIKILYKKIGRMM